MKANTQNFKVPPGDSGNQAVIRDNWALCPESWAKLLRVAPDGVYVWCKRCKREHRVASLPGGSMDIREPESR